MAEMWHYTCDGKPMNPVPFDELKRLADAGTLRPTDMVWQEGMPRWVRANTVGGLFGAADKVSPVAETKPPYSLAAVPIESDDRSLRRRPPKDGGYGVLLLTTFIGFLILGGLFGCVTLMVMYFKTDPSQLVDKKKDDQGAPIDGQWTDEIQVAAGKIWKKTFRFRAGVEYEFRVRPADAKDADLKASIQVFNALGEQVKSLPARNPGTRQLWTPNREDDYRVEVKNEGKDARATLTILDTSQAGGKQEEPLPKDVREGRGSFVTDEIRPGQSATFKFRARRGHVASVAITVLDPDKASNFDLFVRRENDDKVITSDTRPNTHARVEFTLKSTEIVEVRVENASRTASNRCSLIFNVSP